MAGAQELDGLLAGYLDGEPTPEQWTRLAELLKSDPRAGRRVRRELRLHVLCRRLAREAKSIATECGLPVVDAPRPCRRRAARSYLPPARRRRMSVGWWITSIAAGLVLAVGLLWPEQFRALRARLPGGSRGIGSLAAAEGTVYLTRGSRRVTVTGRQPLRWGDQLETAEPGASVALVCPDWARITLGGATRVTLRRARTKAAGRTIEERSLELAQGGVALDVLKTGGEARTKVLSPHAEVLVTGTRLNVRALEDRTYVEVTEGEVRLTSLASGATKLLRSGSYAEIARAISICRRRGGPVPDWIEQIGKGAHPLLAKGFLDVTLYNGWQGSVVDPAGRRDSTAALQKAIEDARDHRLVAFFPSGTYKVSDTLRCANMPSWDAKKRRWRHYGTGRVTVLAGSTRGGRPVIRLADRCPGFTDPDAPNAVVQVWQQMTKRPEDPRPPTVERRPFWQVHDELNSAGEQVFRGIDIHLGAGNTGAIGLAFPGVQGSSIEDTRITATGGYAGLWSVPGRGMGAANIEVVGGRYGILLERGAPCPVFAGVVLRDQTERALHIPRQWSPVTMAGFRIVKDRAPAITLGRNKQGIGGSVALIDGTIEIRAGRGTAIENDEGGICYLRNVCFRGAERAVASKDRPAVACSGAWTRLAEYAYCGSGRESSLNLIDGVVNNEQIVRVQPNSAPPPADLVSRHVWQLQPSFEERGAKDVTDPDIGARGDGQTDDTAALQRAIDRFETVFLPRGWYAISRPLLLRSRTRLVGASKRHTAIMASKEWGGASDAPLIMTEDDPRARTCLANIGLRGTGAGSNLLTWRAGRASLVKSLALGASAPRTQQQAIVRVTGNGGGRWYFWNPGHVPGKPAPEFRLFRVDGTHEPMSCYGLNLPGANSAAALELRNARNVRLFAIKAGNGKDSIQVRNSRNVLVAGFGGHPARAPGGSFLRVIDSRDVAFALAGASDREPARFSVYERNTGGKDFSLPRDKTLTLYKRGTLDDAAWEPLPARSFSARP